MQAHNADRGRILARFAGVATLLPVFFLAALAPAAQAEPRPPIPRFAQLTRDQGLSHNTVLAIVEDHKGFMWLGTADGLNRYDAYSFLVYRNDPEDPHSLSQSYVTALLEDREGTLWIGTLEGLNSYDRDTDSFTRRLNDEQDPTTLSHDSIYSLYEDRGGDLWIGTDRGLDRFDRATETFVHYGPQEPGPARDPGVLRVQAILEDRRGNLWIGTAGSGLYRWDRRSDAFTNYLSEKDDPLSLSHDQVSSLLEDRTGHLWVGTSGGLIRLDPETGTFARFSHDVEESGSLSNNRVETVLLDRRGDLWIGTDWGGLDVLDHSTLTFSHYRHDPSDRNSLTSDAVRTIYEDSKGDLWVGTSNGGVSFYNRNNTNFSYYRHLSNESNSLSHSAVLSFFEEEDGILWIGTEGGLNRFDPNSETFRYYRHDERNPAGLSADAVLAVSKDSRGHLWVGTYYGGLNRLDPSSATFHHYQPDPNDPQSLGSPHVWDILEDSTGRLWLGTFNGVNYFDYDTGTFVRYEHDEDDDTSVGHDIVWQIHEDTDATLWLATQWGLSVYDRARNLFRTYRHDRQDHTSLSSNRVLSIMEDREGILWIGTEGGGLNRFDRETETFKAYRTTDGLPSDVVLGVLEDDAGRLWISTNGGLSRFDSHSEELANYDKSDGLLAYPFARNAYLKSRSGNMLFGGDNGFIIFAPESVKDNPHEPPVVVTGFQVFNKPVDFGGHDSPLELPITEAERIRLRYDQSVFTLAFSALNYRSPEKNRYAFKLDNFDKEWTYLSKNRTVTYTNLNSGEYTFRVRGSNNSGLWNEEGASIEIVVLPPFWATWWFRAAVVLAAAALIVGVYQARMRHVRVRERLLLEMEAKNEELEHFAYTISHDLQAPLVTIRGFLSLLEKDVVRGKTTAIRQDIEQIDGAARKMDRLVQELLDLSRVGHVVNAPQAVTLTDLAFEAAASLAGEIAESGVVIEIQEDMPVVLGDRTRLAEVYQNLIGNAVKYRGEEGESRVEVEARAHGGEAMCCVRDNGPGIAPKYHEKVFGLFERLHADNQGTGIGLALVKRIVEAHGGRIWVESEGDGEGCAFCFTLPTLEAPPSVEAASTS